MSAKPNVSTSDLLCWSETPPPAAVSGNPPRSHQKTVFRNIGSYCSDDGKSGKKASKGDREKLGLDHAHHKEKKEKKGHKKASGEPHDAMEKVEMEKEKQDEALDELSSVLGDLKGMAGEMGSELDSNLCLIVVDGKLFDSCLKPSN